MCGEHSYAVLICRKQSVCQFILCMGQNAAKRYCEHRTLRKADFMPGDGWYIMAVDCSFESMEEVFRILDECYDYALKKFYVKKNT